MTEYLYFVFALLINTVGQIFLKKGMMSLSSLNSEFSLNYFVKCFTNIYVVLGLCFYAIFTMVWLILLAKFPLSLVYSVLTLGYVMILLVSIFIFKEQISILSWSGSLFIIIGVTLFSMGMKG